MVSGCIVASGPGSGECNVAGDFVEQRSLQSSQGPAFAGLTRSDSTPALQLGQAMSPGLTQSDSTPALQLHRSAPHTSGRPSDGGGVSGVTAEKSEVWLNQSSGHVSRTPGEGSTSYWTEAMCHNTIRHSGGQPPVLEVLGPSCSVSTLRKSALCPNLRLRGVCRLPDCPYVHEVGRARRLRDSPGWKRMPWEMCRAARACDRQDCQAVPCRFVELLGACPYGSACNYSHLPKAAVAPVRPTSACSTSRLDSPIRRRRFVASGPARGVARCLSELSLVAASDGLGSRHAGVLQLARDSRRLCE